MALYVPAGARRRRLVLIAGVALLVGAALGFLIGRSSAEGLAEEVDAVRAQATDSATALERIPIEYEQALLGEGGESIATVTGAVERARAELDDAFERAIWFGPDAARAANEAFDAVADAVVDEDDPAEVEAEIAQAVDEIERTFGLSS